MENMYCPEELKTTVFEEKTNTWECTRCSYKLHKLNFTDKNAEKTEGGNNSGT